MEKTELSSTIHSSPQSIGARDLRTSLLRKWFSMHGKTIRKSSLPAHLHRQNSNGSKIIQTYSQNNFIHLANLYTEKRAPLHFKMGALLLLTTKIFNQPF